MTTALLGLTIGFGGGTALLALAFSGPEIRAVGRRLTRRGPGA
jgi:tRNA G46 methylase TrmB